MKRAFVIGHPIAHSRSPAIHNHWLRAYGIEGSYEAIDVAPDALAGFFDRLRAGEFAGGNVTIPHKEMAFALADSRDALSERIGAVNTLVRDGDRIAATNTDYLGFLGNLDQNVPGWSDGLKTAIVLGAGGASRAILVALLERGVEKIHLLNRTLETAEALALDLAAPILAGRISDFAAAAPKAGLLVNTTSVGMKNTRFADLPLDLLPKKTLVTDIVYVPLMTPLLIEAQERGHPIVDGLGMLLHQAVPGFEAWFGVRPDVTPELRRLIEATL
ncbi:MAG: shikimate dehydrogenase [Devosia sp.]